MDQEPAVYQVREVAALLGLDPKSVYAAVQSGELPGRRVGRRVLIPRKAFDRWLAEADRASSEAA